MKIKRFKLGDYVKTNKKSAIEGSGKITNIVRGGKNLGFPWEDDTNHYIFLDERTGIQIIAHPNSLEMKKGGKYVEKHF